MWLFNKTNRCKARYLISPKLKQQPLPHPPNYQTALWIGKLQTFGTGSSKRKKKQIPPHREVVLLFCLPRGITLTLLKTAAAWEWKDHWVCPHPGMWVWDRNGEVRHNLPQRVVGQMKSWLCKYSVLPGPTGVCVFTFTLKCQHMTVNTFPTNFVSTPPTRKQSALSLRKNRNKAPIHRQKPTSWFIGVSLSYLRSFWGKESEYEFISTFFFLLFI